MKIRNKILLGVLTTLLLSGMAITAIWYSTSRKLLDTYLENISNSTMLDAYHAFEYLLTDTSYMATLIATNQANIIEPVEYLVTNELKVNNQWNQGYLDNKRTIMNYIGGLNGYKYYISGIAVAADGECIFSTSYIIQDKSKLYEEVLKLDQEKLKKSVVMMEPFHLEARKSTVSSDYIVPAVRGIVNDDGQIIGYVILYFDYGVIDKMFVANLPKNSYFQVVNEHGSIIFANEEMGMDEIQKGKKGYAYNTFEAKNVGWTFYSAIPSSFYISEIQKTALLSSIVIVAVIILACLNSIFVVSKMTTEITVLSEQMGKVSEGDFNIQYEIKSVDEVGQMGYAFNHMVVRIKKLMGKVAEEERQKHLNKMAFLQAQINPHFISNVLNNVVWMAKIQHADNLVPLVNSLNFMLQNVMHQEKDLIRLQDELEYLDYYLTIMEYTGSYDFRMEKKVDEDVLPLYIPRFILQPIVENSISHGMPMDLSREGVIRLSAYESEGQLIVNIEDNGEGMSSVQIENIMANKAQNGKSFNGVGVSNVNERIQLFFGKDYGLHYESEIGKYTRCVFILPIIKEEETWD